MTFSDIGRVTPTRTAYICGRCGKTIKKSNLAALLELGWTVQTYGGVGVSRTVYFCSAMHQKAYHLKIL